MVPFLLWFGVLFPTSYLLMLAREKVGGIVYDGCDFRPTLFVSLLAPPIGIVFALAEIAAFKLGLKDEGEHAV